MGYTPPDYCPDCGTELSTAEEPWSYRCDSCDQWVFHNPTPTARVTVLDGESILLVRHTSGVWLQPGGHLTPGEQPQDAGARELKEETGLAVDPADLKLYDAHVAQPIADHHGIVILYAVERSVTRGALEAGSDAHDARFWSPEEAAGSGIPFREMHAEAPGRGELAWWLVEARVALEGT